MIKCPVCNNELIEFDTLYKCSNNHSFDKNKKGYTNLLLANQMHSIDPDDNKEMVMARVNFLKTNKYKVLRDSIETIINQYKENEYFNIMFLL